MMRKLIVACLFTGGAAAGFGQTVVSTSGAINLLSTPPASVVPDAFLSQTQIEAFKEQQDVTLAKSIHLDVDAPGTYDAGSGGAPGTVAAGTVVDSFFLHTNWFGPVTLRGSVTFKQTILGFEFYDGSLDATDFLGAAGTTYPTGTGNRGYEPGDIAGISADGHTITVNPSFSEPGDQLRVITLAKIATPGPSAALPMLIAAGASFLRRRRR